MYSVAPFATAEPTVQIIVPQATSDDDLVDLWLRNYRSPNTRVAYAGDIREFRAFVSKPLRGVTLRDVQDYGASLASMAPASIGRRLSSVKSLVKFAFKLGFLPFDTASPVQLPAIKDRLAEKIMSEPDVQRLLWLEKDARNGALLRLIYGAGLRVSEACSLCWRDLTPRDDAGQLNIFGKGGKTRVVLLPAALWRRVYALRGKAEGDAAVFRSRKGGCLDPATVHRILKRAAKRAKLPEAVSVHYLRHAHVSHALDRGAPIHVVRATVGHASLETTTRYSHSRPDDSSARYLTA